MRSHHKQLKHTRGLIMSSVVLRQSSVMSHESCVMSHHSPVVTCGRDMRNDGLYWISSQNNKHTLNHALGYCMLCIQSFVIRQLSVIGPCVLTCILDEYRKKEYSSQLLFNEVACRIMVGQFPPRLRTSELTLVVNCPQKMISSFQAGRPSL